MLRFAHINFNVRDLEKSLAFYKEAFGLTEVRRKEAEDKSFIIVYLGLPGDPFLLELTWLREHPQAYDLGEEEFHLAFETDEFDNMHALHKQMGCICFENEKMGIYFVKDPDGYWVEVVPKRT